jgi:ABC-type sugar transport system ATPase subunit
VVTAAAGVTLRRLAKRFGAVVALHPLDLAIAAGELVVLVGPSGCGKTTALRLVAGLEEPTAGTVHIGDRDVTQVEPADRDIAMVFQNYALYPHMTVRENLAFGLRMRRTAAAEAGRRVAWASSVLGLDGLLERRPGELSGGQKQRVAFGRAMVREPQVFLFDEPLSNLDARLRADMRREIADLHARLGATMIYVTHDQVEAMTLGQRIAVMKDGRLQQFAPPLDIYRRPANLYVAGFVGTPAINTAAASIADVGAPALVAGRLRLRLPPAPAGARPDGTGDLTLAIRPESLALVSPDGGDFETRVQRVEQLGNEALVHVDGPAGAPWVVRAPSTVAARSGDTAGVRIDRAAALLFDASGTRLDAGLVAEALA